MVDVIGTYRARVASGEILSDPAQASAAERLQGLWVKLRGYDPHPKGPPNGWVGKLLRRKQVDEAGEHPHGLYLVGDVGRGKSMLMDLFFEAADVPRKRRIHFHEFMQETHKRFHQIKRDNPAVDDPVPVLADMIAGEAALLCFDEFQVHDIVDAMILGRLFEALFARLVVVVATSNTLPDDLFKGKPGRDAFLPFIGFLKKNLDVLVLDAARDYRRERVHGLKAWSVPADSRADAQMQRVFDELTDGVAPQASSLMIAGRQLPVPLSANGVARFDFHALCGAALGPGDYLALATHFHTVLIDGIPRLSPDNFDEARRFITLVDALYEHRVKLYASAAAMPDELYKRGENAQIFERTASRLEEMQSETYLALPHLT
ncbi:MAG: cell division protein ZapE [Acidocella sp. 20-57-95]|nr:MAG: cell division protein ZapE [Acidocella sp. 20-57-95]OYV62019.1 MAG: cell division protein ZapE [Acidocella sp. 21-58-7]HQT64262.1 cell division protein ZapE [Acidocella sp.]HQU05249.1 cell division protein ZapE [Acidocella sp.]